ncbi:uncharacterized protein JCM10292_007406 [Rhodotorula paludigena]|uniref:uncharacterized protein n=1 Tax=Rhodotorula paludigena TaxID=86838 RepID=UPI0031822170
MASSSSNRTSQGLAQGASGRRVAPAGQQLAIAPKPEGFSAHGLHVGTVTGSEAAAALRDKGSSAEEQAALLRHDRFFVRQAGSLQEFCSPSGQVVARRTVANTVDEHDPNSPPGATQTQIHRPAQHLPYQQQDALAGHVALEQSGHAASSHSLVAVGPSQVAQRPPSGSSANVLDAHGWQPQQQDQYLTDQQAQQAQQVPSSAGSTGYADSWTPDSYDSGRRPSLSAEQRSSQAGPQRRDSVSGRTKPFDTSARRSPFRHSIEDDNAGHARSLSFWTRTTSRSDAQEIVGIAVGLSRSTSERRPSSHNPPPPAFGSRSVARSEANTLRTSDASRPGSRLEGLVERARPPLQPAGHFAGLDIVGGTFSS